MYRYKDQGFLTVDDAIDEWDEDNRDIDDPDYRPICADNVAHLLEQELDKKGLIGKFEVVEDDETVLVQYRSTGDNIVWLNGVNQDDGPINRLTLPGTDIEDVVVSRDDFAKVHVEVAKIIAKLKVRKVADEAKATWKNTSVIVPDSVLKKYRD